jgi:hypothetical protein
MLDRIGEPELSSIAAERALAAAERSESDLLVAVAAWRLAVVLRHDGQLQEATEVPVAVANALRGHLGESPQHASVYGALMLKAAVGAATLHDHTAVRDYLGECDRSAQRTGDRNDHWLAFGPPTWRSTGCGWPPRWATRPTRSPKPSTSTRRHCPPS